MLTVLRPAADYSLTSGVILPEKEMFVNENLAGSGCIDTFFR